MDSPVTPDGDLSAARCPLRRADHCLGGIPTWNTCVAGTPVAGRAAPTNA